MATDIFDTDTSEFPELQKNRVEKLLTIINDYNDAVNITQLRAFYKRKHGEMLDSGKAGTYINYLFSKGKIQRLERGLYASLEYVKQ